MKWYWVSMSDRRLSNQGLQHRVEDIVSLPIFQPRRGRTARVDSPAGMCGMLYLPSGLNSIRSPRFQQIEGIPSQ